MDAKRNLSSWTAHKLETVLRLKDATDPIRSIGRCAVTKQ
jgi:hypothetical protein